MLDPTDDVLAPTVIERVMDVYEKFKDRKHSNIVQARKAVTQQVFDLIDRGERDSQKLAVAALAFLKRLEIRNQSGDS